MKLIGYCSEQEDCSKCIFRTKVTFGNIVFDKCEYDDNIIVYAKGDEDLL